MDARLGHLLLYGRQHATHTGQHGAGRHGVGGLGILLQCGQRSLEFVSQPGDRIAVPRHRSSMLIQHAVKASYETLKFQRHRRIQPLPARLIQILQLPLQQMDGPGRGGNRQPGRHDTEQPDDDAAAPERPDDMAGLRIQRLSGCGNQHHESTRLRPDRQRYQDGDQVLIQRALLTPQLRLSAVLKCLNSAIQQREVGQGCRARVLRRHLPGRPGNQHPVMTGVRLGILAL